MAKNKGGKRITTFQKNRTQKFFTNKKGVLGAEIKFFWQKFVQTTPKLNFFICKLVKCTVGNFKIFFEIFFFENFFFEIFIFLKIFLRFFWKIFNVQTLQLANAGQTLVI